MYVLLLLESAKLYPKYKHSVEQPLNFHHIFSSFFVGVILCNFNELRHLSLSVN